MVQEAEAHLVKAEQGRRGTLGEKHREALEAMTFLALLLQVMSPLPLSAEHAPRATHHTPASAEPDDFSLRCDVPACRGRTSHSAHTIRAPGAAGRRQALRGRGAAARGDGGKARAARRLTLTPAKPYP